MFLQDFTLSSETKRDKKDYIISRLFNLFWVHFVVNSVKIRTCFTITNPDWFGLLKIPNSALINVLAHIWPSSHPLLWSQQLENQPTLTRTGIMIQSCPNPS